MDLRKTMHTFFCTEEQVLAEVGGCIDSVYEIYKIFGFESISVKLSTRPEKRVGVTSLGQS